MEIFEEINLETIQLALLNDNIEYCRFLAMAQLWEEVDDIQILQENYGIFQHESLSHYCGLSDSGSEPFSTSVVKIQENNVC